MVPSDLRQSPRAGIDKDNNFLAPFCFCVLLSNVHSLFSKWLKIVIDIDIYVVFSFSISKRTDPQQFRCETIVGCSEDESLEG